MFHINHKINQKKFNFKPLKYYDHATKYSLSLMTVMFEANDNIIYITDNLYKKFHCKTLSVHNHYRKST